MDATVATFGIWQLLILITAVLAFLMPFFVLRIRNESIKTNRKLDEIISLMHTSNTTSGHGGTSTKATSMSGKQICTVCDRENKLTAIKCDRCGEELL